MSLLPKKPVMDQEFVKTAAHVNYATVGRKLTESVREYKTAAVVTPLLVLGEVVFEVMIPLYTADLIDAIKSGADLSQILSTGGVLALMALVSLAFGAAAGLTCAKASTGFAKNLRKDMFYNIQTFSFAVIDRFSSSSLVTRITTDVMNVQMAYMMLIRTAIRSPFMLVLAFIAAYSMAGWLALVFVVIIPVLAVALLTVIRKVVPVFRRIFRKYDALNERAEENLAGIRVVKSFANEQEENRKFSVGNQGFLAAKKNSYHYMGTFQAGVGFFTTLIQVSVIITGCVLIANGRLDIPDLVTFLLYISVFTEPITTLVNFTEQFQNGYTGFERFRELMDIEPDIEDSPNAVPLEKCARRHSFRQCFLPLQRKRRGRSAAREPGRARRQLCGAGRLVWCWQDHALLADPALLRRFQRAHHRRWPRHSRGHAEKPARQHRHRAAGGVSLRRHDL